MHIFHLLPIPPPLPPFHTSSSHSLSLSLLSNLILPSTKIQSHSLLRILVSKQETHQTASSRSSRSQISTTPPVVYILPSSMSSKVISFFRSTRTSPSPPPSLFPPSFPPPPYHLNSHSPSHAITVFRFYVLPQWTMTSINVLESWQSHIEHQAYARARRDIAAENE